MSTWPRVYRVLRDYKPLGAKAGDHIYYDLREPTPVRLVRLADDHGRMLAAEMDGVIEPLDGALLPSHDLSQSSLPSPRPRRASLRMVR